MTAAGWYPDGTGLLRWWDGQAWTAHVQALTATAAGTPLTPSVGFAAPVAPAPDSSQAVPPAAPAAPIPTIPAGWYPDGTGRRRWWDGQRWTTQLEDAPVPPGRTRRKSATSPRLLVALAAVLVVALAAGAVIGVGSTDRDSGRPYPSRWDARLAPIADEVEDIRGLKFDHPVRARFLTDAEFEAGLRKQSEHLSRSATRKVRALQAGLRSVALIGSDVDLVKALRDLSASSTLAYYDIGDKTITVRGTELGPAERATVAHELTHALQDQEFGLERGRFLALVEGDASRVATQYVTRMSEQDQAAMGASTDEDIAVATGALDDAGVPTALRLVQEAPYTLGEVMLQVAEEMRPDGVNWLFDHQPKHESAFLSPWTLDDARRSVVIPERFSLEPGDTRLGDIGPLDAYGLYVMLASRIGPDQALRGADLWGGDRWVAFRRDGQDCSRVVLRGRSATGRATLLNIVQVWAATFPDGAVDVTPGAVDITVTACTTVGGLGPSDPVTGAEDIVMLPLLRNTLYGELLSGSGALDESTVVCLADTLARSPALAQSVARASQLGGRTDAASDAEMAEYLAQQRELQAQLLAEAQAACL